MITNLSLQRETTFKIRGGGSEFRRSKDPDASCLCSICQNPLALDSIWRGPDRANHNVDALKGCCEGGSIVIIDDDKPGTLCNPFWVRRICILEYPKSRSGHRSGCEEGGGRAPIGRQRNRGYSPNGFQPQQLLDNETPNVPRSYYRERTENHLVFRERAKEFSRWGWGITNGAPKLLRPDQYFADHPQKLREVRISGPYFSALSSSCKEVQNVDNVGTRRIRLALYSIEYGVGISP